MAAGVSATTGGVTGAKVNGSIVGGTTGKGGPAGSKPVAGQGRPSTAKPNLGSVKTSTDNVNPTSARGATNKTSAESKATPSRGALGKKKDEEEKKTDIKKSIVS